MQNLYRFCSQFVTEIIMENKKKKENRIDVIFKDWKDRIKNTQMKDEKINKKTSCQKNTAQSKTSKT
jgi:hypothetical protein